MLYRTLTVILLLISMVNCDPITFRVIMDCDYSIGHYCGHMLIYEEDYRTHHDKVKDDYFCTDEKKRDVTFPPMKVGGDVSPQYEFGYRLTHNCTTDGSVRCVKPRDIAHIPEHGPQTVEFYALVYNQGTDGECKHPNEE